MTGRRSLIRVTMTVLLLLGCALALGAAEYPWAHQPSPAARHPVSTTSPTSTPSPPAPLRVVGLGDSVPAADTCGCAGFLEQLAPDLRASTGRAVDLRNDATSGWTTQDVLDDLAHGQARADLRAGADLVVVEIGANDFELSRLGDPSCAPAGTSPCFRDTLGALRSGLTSIVDRVRGLAPTARVALLGYWNVGVDGSVGRARGSTYVAGSDALTRAVNEVVAGVAGRTGATYVDTYSPLKGADGRRDPTEDLLDDGDHPDASGHARLADAVLDALQAGGAVAGWAAQAPGRTGGG